MIRARVLKVRRVERHEIVVVQLPDDVLDRAELDAPLAAHQFPVVADVGVGVLAERYPRREVAAVGDDAEVEVAGEAIVVPRIDLVDLDDEPRGVVGRHVGDDAEGGGEVLQGLVVAGVEDDLGPGLGDDAQHEGDDAAQHPVRLQQPVLVAAGALGHLLRLPVRVGEQPGNVVALHARALSVEFGARQRGAVAHVRQQRVPQGVRVAHLRLIRQLEHGARRLLDQLPDRRVGLQMVRGLLGKAEVNVSLSQSVPARSLSYRANAPPGALHEYFIERLNYSFDTSKRGEDAS